MQRIGDNSGPLCIHVQSTVQSRSVRRTQVKSSIAISHQVENLFVFGFNYQLLAVIIINIITIIKNESAAQPYGCERLKTLYQSGNPTPHNQPIIIIVKKGRQCKAERESDIHPISPKIPAPQYQPVDRKKRKGKIVEDYSRDRAALANKEALALLLKPVSPTPSNTGLARSFQRTMQFRTVPPIINGGG